MYVLVIFEGRSGESVVWSLFKFNNNINGVVIDVWCWFWMKWWSDWWDVELWFLLLKVDFWVLIEVNEDLGRLKELSLMLNMIMRFLRFFIERFEDGLFIVVIWIV